MARRRLGRHKELFFPTLESYLDTNDYKTPSSMAKVIAGNVNPVWHNPGGAAADIDVTLDHTLGTQWGTDIYIDILNWWGYTSGGHNGFEIISLTSASSVIRCKGVPAHTTIRANVMYIYEHSHTC